jgi:hypothetical protein
LLKSDSLVKKNIEKTYKSMIIYIIKNNKTKRLIQDQYFHITEKLVYIKFSSFDLTHYNITNIKKLNIKHSFIQNCKFMLNISK